MSPPPEFLKVEEILESSNNEKRKIQELKKFLHDNYLTFDIIRLLLRSNLSSINICSIFNDISIPILKDLYDIPDYLDNFINIILTREIDKDIQHLINTVEFVFQPE